MQRRSQNNTPITVLGVGSGGVEELRELLEDSSVSWALIRFQVGSTSKFASLHFNGEEVGSVKRGRLNARTQEVLTMFGEAHTNLEVKWKEEFTLDFLCEKMLPVFGKAAVAENNSSAAELKQGYELAVQSCREAQSEKDKLNPSSDGRFTAKDRPDLEFTTEKCLKAVALQQGQFNWVLMEPTKLELHNAGYGGIEEMKQSLDVNKVLFGLARMAFGRSEAQCGQAFVPGIVKHVFIHFIGHKVPVVKRGQWNAKQKDAEKEIKSVCAPMLRKECHSEEELDLQELITELDRLAIASSPSSLDESVFCRARINAKDYEEALAAEMKEYPLRWDGGSGAAGGLPEAKTAITTVRSTSGLWNWALFGASTMPVQPAQSRPSVAIMPVGVMKKDAGESPAKEDGKVAEEAGSERAAAERAASEKAAAERAASEKAAADKTASEDVVAGKAAAEKATAEKAAAEKAAAASAAAAHQAAKAATSAEPTPAPAQSSGVYREVRTSIGGSTESLTCATEQGGPTEGQDKFTLHHPIPDSHLGAYDVLVDVESQRLGWFSSAMPPEDLLVVQVEPGSWSDRIGIKTGDELMEVQGRDIKSIDEKDFIGSMHVRPLVLSFFRQQGARDKMLQRGSLPVQGRGSTPLRPSVVDRLNAKEDVRASFVERQNHDVESSKERRTSKVLQTFAQWEDFVGELYIRSGWSWKRRFCQLAKGHLRFWKQKEIFMQDPRPAAEVDVCLVQAASRWKVEGLKGSRFELNYHIVGSVAPRTMPVPVDETKEPAIKSFLQRASARLRSSSTGATRDVSRERSDLAETGQANAVTQYLIAADDTTSATQWTRAIWHHVAYVDMLSIWPMPLEGRQGDIESYGIDAPPEDE